MLSSAGLYAFLIMRPIQRLSSPKDNELKMSATLAGQLYKHQEAQVLAGALEAAERISALALVEQLAVMQPIPGASSRPGATSLNLQREAPLRAFDKMATELQQKYNFDFLILTDTDGKVITTANPTPALDDWIKNSRLYKESKAARVISVDISGPNIQLLLADKPKNGQTGAPQKVETALVIEALAPVLRTQGELLGLVFAGHIVNDSKNIVSAAKTEVSRAHPMGADVSIVFQNQIISTTVDGVTKGQRPVIDPGFSKSLEPSIHSFDLSGRHVLGGFYPIRASDSVIGQVMVTQTVDPLTDAISTIGWPAIYGLGATFIFTMIVVLLLTSRLTKALRRVNTDIIRIGLGDFEDPIEPPTRRDEAGDLVESLERLRVTVKQAIERLRRRG